MTQTNDVDSHYWKWLIVIYVLAVLFAPPLPFEGHLSQLRITDFLFVGVSLVFLVSQRFELQVPKDLFLALLCYLSAYGFGVAVTLVRNPNSAILAIAYFGKFVEYAAIFTVLFSIFTTDYSLGRTVRKVIIGALIINAIWVFIAEVVGTGRPTGIGTASIFITGYLLAFLILLSAPHTIPYQQRVETELLSLFGVVTGLLALFANGSRAILVGTIVGLSATIMYFSWRFMALLTVVGVISITSLSAIGVLGLRRLTELRHLLTNPTSIRSLRIRFARWEHGIDIWVQNPITGRGLATVTEGAFIENLYIAFLAEMGIVGFILLVVSSAFFIRFFVRYLTAGRNVQSALVGLSSICVLSITGVFSQSLWGIRSMELFSIIIALLAVHLHEDGNDQNLSD